MGSLRYLGDDDVRAVPGLGLGAKLVTVFPGNGRGYIDDVVDHLSRVDIDLPTRCTVRSG